MEKFAFDKDVEERSRGFESLESFCSDWEQEYRGIAVAAQSLLRQFLPAAAKVIGMMIAVVDAFCATQNGDKK